MSDERLSRFFRKVEEEVLLAESTGIFPYEEDPKALGRLLKKGHISQG